MNLRPDLPVSLERTDQNIGQFLCRFGALQGTLNRTNGATTPKWTEVLSSQERSSPEKQT